MRVLHILKHCERGNGHVHVAVDLACEQVLQGHEVVFASGGGTYVELLEANGVSHVVVCQDKIKFLKGLIDFLRIVRSFRPDIIHAHMMLAALIGFISARVFKSILVTTVHNSFDKHSFFMRLGDAIVAVSHAERDLLVSRGYNEKKISVLYNGPLGSPREKLENISEIEVSPRTIMTLSGLHQRKRVNDAIKAFSIVSPEFPDWQLLIVGSGPDEQLLKKLCEQLDISDRVTFAGHLLNPGKALRAASIFVCLSELEPFGLVVVEARAAGCAVIVSNAGGLPEVVEYGRRGIVVPFNRPDATAAVLRNLIECQDELDRWQTAAKVDLNRFSVKTMAQSYEKLYFAVLAS